MDIAFVSACFGKFDIEEYRHYVYPTVDEYSKDHNIDFHLIEKSLDPDRDPQWSKILAVQKYLHDYDWLVWIDADIMIMNQTIDIREYIEEDYEFIITEFQKQEFYNLNTGLFFIKGKSEWSERFLNGVYYGNNQFVNNPTKKYHEQSSMGVFFENNKIENKVLIREPTIHKSWPIFMPDPEDLLLHPNDGQIQTWLRRYQTRYFKKGDFTAHVLSRDIEDRARIYRLLSNHVIWHD